MLLLSRLKHVSKLNSTLLLSKWISSNGRNSISFSWFTLPSPRRLIYSRSSTNSVNLCDRNSSSNRKFERVARYVNKGIMSSINEPSHLKSAGPNDETDDISLTFWICLWGCLAIVASWVYTKLNSSKVAVEDGNSQNNVEPGADERIAQKLVNEISRKDLVKRSTFRRQRSYEIIDGEVRIHYDVYWDRPLQEKTNHDGNIVDSAEVDSFPTQKSSLDEIELIFPGNLPRIIEEGEEESGDKDETEEIVQGQALSSSYTCPILDGDRENIPVIKVVDYDSEINSNLNFQDTPLGKKQQDFTEIIEPNSGSDNLVRNVIKEPPEDEQTNVTEMITSTAKKKSNAQENTTPKTSILSDVVNSSSDETSSNSVESVIENVQNTQLLRDEDEASNSTKSSVNKLTEVRGTDGDCFTATRREVRKFNTSGKKCMDSAMEDVKQCTTSDPLRMNSTEVYTLEEVLECFESEKRLNVFRIKADKSYHNGMLVTCSQTITNSEQNINTKEETINQPYDLASTEEKGNAELRDEPRNVHEPEMQDLSNRKLLNTSVDQADSVDNTSGELNSKPRLGSTEDSDCDTAEQLPFPAMGKADELTENFEEGFHKLSYLEDGDIFTDNTGDVLFKVIGPSEEFLEGNQYLEDIEEADEYLGGEQFVLDQNKNYQMFEPEVEFSKSWRSLPSWEKTHHIRHRELDRDADDSVMDSEHKGDEQSDDAENANFQTVKSEETILSNIEPILEQDDLEFAETIENLNEHHSVLQSSSDRAEDMRLKTKTVETNLDSVGIRCDISHTSEVIFGETMPDVNVYALKHDKLLIKHKRNDNENSNAVEVVTKGQMISDNKKGQEVDLKLPVENEKYLVVSRTSNEQDKSMEKELVDANQNTLTKSIAAEGGPKTLKYFQDEETGRGGMINPESSVSYQSCENPQANITKEVKNENESSDEKIVAVCLNANTTQESANDIIYANEVLGDQRNASTSQNCNFTSNKLVLSHENHDTKKFKETSLDDIPLASNTATVMYLNKNVEQSKSPFPEGTNIDSLSDVDEIEIDNTEVKENYDKSKTVTDLDQALASYGASGSWAGDGKEEENETNYTSSLSKSVPDILDGFQEGNLKEAAFKTKSNTSIDSLTKNLQKKNLSVSSPEIASLKKKEGLKKITKIKIVHVKFLEVEDGSGSENIEEDSFTVGEGMLMSGKIKRRNKHFSDDNSQLTGTELSVNKEVVDDHFTAKKTTEKQLDFAFDDLFNDLPSSPSSAQNIPSTEIQGLPSSSIHSDISIHHHSINHSSAEMLPQRERYIAKYGNIPLHLSSSQKAGSLHHGVKLSEKFQLQQDDASQHQKSSASSSYQSKIQLKPEKESKVRSHTPSPTAHHGGCFVTVKSGVINDNVYSSDADSETSYNTPPPQIRTRKFHHTIAHQDTTDSASSSEPDSPRTKGRTKHKASMSQIFGVQSDILHHSDPQNLRKEQEISKIPPKDPKLFSRFGHLQQGDLPVETKSYSKREWDGAMEGNVGTSYNYQTRKGMSDEVGSYRANRNMEFNPFVEVDGYNDNEPFERSHSPTSISSDQSSVFSFNCDFEPMPVPTSNFHPEVYTCENPWCRKQDILLGPEKTSFKSCPACFTYYCSSECRKLHWPAHKQICYFGRVNTYVRSIIRLCQRRQDLSMYLSQLARDGYIKKGRGVVMATFNSPQLAREFITKGHDAFSGRKPTYSSLAELSREGVISKHRVAVMQAVRDYEPNEEFVFNIAVVAVNDIPMEPAPRYKLNTVLHCIKMPLNEKIVARQPKEHGRVETRLFALPKCSRHEFVNEMEARRHYCRNLSKNLRLYNIKLKQDYQDCYKKLCMYVEHDIPFEPMIVYGERSGITYKCIIGPEQSYPLNPEYC